MKNNQSLHLKIMGKGTEVEKTQKRLRCAARATNIELQLLWHHENPQNEFKNAKHIVAVIYNETLLIDGLIPTEEIEKILIILKGNS